MPTRPVRPEKRIKKRLAQNLEMHLMPGETP
jgi:hypothetical protein